MIDFFIRRHYTAFSMNGRSTKQSSAVQSNRERLERIRKTLDLSQRELARKLGVVESAVGLWESGRRKISKPVLKLLELYEEDLGISISSESPEYLNQVISSSLHRNIKISSAVTKVLAQYIGRFTQSIFSSDSINQVRKETQRTAIQQMVKSMGELKGLIMKIGQMMSYIDFALSDENRAILATLQNQTKPISPQRVIDIFLKDFGKTPRQLFAEWNPQAFAAASIGQVHWARLANGDEVAVKVQYPEITRVLQSDLENAKRLDRFMSLIFRGPKKNDFFAELSERLLEECDYEKEAEYQQAFGERFAHELGVLIPSIYPEFSTKQVLTTQYFNALSFQDFLKQARSEEKNRAALTIFKFAMDSIFKHNFFNADPHPGNYLFQGTDVVFLDFGCVKRYSREFVESWCQLQRAMMERDFRRVNDLMIAHGFVPRLNKFDFLYNRNGLLMLYQPALFEEPFTFTKEYIRNIWQTTLTNNSNWAYTNIPKDWVMHLFRLQLGLHTVMAQLQAKGDFRKVLLDVLYTPDEKKPRPYTRKEFNELIEEHPLFIHENCQA